MAPATRLCLLLPLRPVASAAGAAAASRGGGARVAAASASARAIHSHPAQPAKVVPVYGTGPPPEPPQPIAEFAAEERDERLARRRRQAEMLRQAGDIKAIRQQQRQEQQQQQESNGTTTKPVGLKRRFWKDVDVKEVNGALEIHLDARPLRHPTTKSIIRLPPSKPHLAHALALEWDSLTSAAQATKQHLIPLTSLTCRALDIAANDTSGDGSIRAGITTTLLRYLDTDSLLCFAPAPTAATHGHNHNLSSSPEDGNPTLHALQHQAYTSTVTYLTTHAWPGVTIVPVLDSNSIMPQHQAPGTREVVQGWILSLSPFELAGLERATLGGKSLLAAARLVVEWSEEGAHSQAAKEYKGKRFGVEEAARAVSLEVEWQTRQWGEVEDTHDVEKEDLRRQFGSVVLLVSGSGTGSKRG